jgi:hypothetical protein
VARARSPVIHGAATVAADELDEGHGMRRNSPSTTMTYSLAATTTGSGIAPFITSERRSRCGTSRTGAAGSTSSG